MESRFELGRVNVTGEIADKVAESAEFAKFVNESLRRHARGDWGDVSQENKTANDEALDHDGQLLSEYQQADQPRIRIITTADRSVTMIFLAPA